MVKYEPVIRWDPPATIEVYPDKVRADGGMDFYPLADNRDLFIRCDKVK
jgi:hypothetical protein